MQAKSKWVIAALVVLTLAASRVLLFLQPTSSDLSLTLTSTVSTDGFANAHQLAESSAARLKRLGYTNITVKSTDGYYGWEEHANGK